MEFWWWIEPLFYTGLVMLAFAILIDWNDVSIAVAITLILPLIVSGVAAFLWFLANIFVRIWSPYFG